MRWLDPCKRYLFQDRFVKFRTDDHGVAAIEFALLFPVLLIIVAASVDICEGLSARGKVTNIAASMAGFVADQNQWKYAEVDDLLKGGAFMMAARKPEDLKIRVSVLSVSADGSVKVKSSRALETTALSPGAPSPVPTPATIKSPGTDVVLAEVTYSLAPPFAQLWPDIAVVDLYKIEHHYFARPRRSSTVSMD